MFKIIAIYRRLNCTTQSADEVNKVTVHGFTSISSLLQNGCDYHS